MTAIIDTESPHVTRRSDWLGGLAVFADSRVPIDALFCYLKNNHSLNEFLSDYPSVSRAQVVDVLDVAARSLAVRANSVTP